MTWCGQCSATATPPPLGEAISSYGRIFKSWHVLALLDDESYRRDIKGIRNL
jgi:TnpA family transposase